MIRVRLDPKLKAVAHGKRQLVYSDAAPPSMDRPAHVRAGSALARIGTRLAVLQDDANFIALVDGDSVRSIPLPAAKDGRRQFSEELGNKQNKLDLEACVVVDKTLVAFGSGSTRERERIVIATGLDCDQPKVQTVLAPQFYRLLRENKAFSGSELNLEGAAKIGDRLVLFQRGNGAAIDGLAPVNATCEVSYDALWEYLQTGAGAPEPLEVKQYDLGTIGTVPWTFSDATVAPSGSLVFLATAEDSPNAYDDGVVIGVAVGVLDESGARMTPLRTSDGSLVRDKAEGISIRTEDPTRADLAIDRDDPDAPCELAEIELVGFP
ncbi:MAG: hypothetical protein U0169_01865 [Polyangiaceae bacterium]